MRRPPRENGPPEFRPYLPTVGLPSVGSIRSRSKLDRSVARWRPMEERCEDSRTLARLQAVGSSSLPTLPSIPAASSRSISGSASMANLWRDAGNLLQRKEAELPMLKPPVAHKVLGLGREAVGKRRRSPVVGIRPGRPIPSLPGLPGLPGLASPQASQPSPLSGGTRVDNKRRFSTQGALATDLAYVQEQLAKVTEAPTDEKQEKQEVDRWWCAIFLPLPAPRQLLPLVLADQQGLVGDPDGQKEREKFQAQVKLAPDELEEVVRLCHTFVQMVQPPQITLEHQEEISENVLLSRPSFCQLLVAMGLTSMEKCLVPRYHYALKCFDAEASSCEVPGIAPFGRLVMAVRLPALPAKDESALEGLVNDRLTPRITRLFGRLLEDLALLPFWEGQDMAEALPRAKKYFFFKMLPAAQAYGDERIQVLQKQAIQLKHENIRISSSNSSQLPEAEATEPATSVAGDLDTTKGAPSLRGLSAGSATSRSSISHFTRMTSHDLDAISEVSEALSSPKKLPRASRTGASLGSRQTTRTKRDATVKILEVQPPAPLEDATVMEPVPLPPEMVKAEFMQNQLLEPEVLSFVATFSSIFQVLFRAYSDFPARDMGGGHMSISAFLRFCYDFGLFSVIDLQSLQRLYSLCSETLELSAPKDAKPKKRRGNKKPEQVFFWNGLQVPQRFEWLTKEFAHHDAQEAACAGVLGAMHDWMKDRTWTPNDLFTLLDWNGNGGICAEELVEGVRLMRLDHLPPCEELQRLAWLLLSPETGSITPYELQQALAIIAKLVLAANFFLKADQDMSEVERNASVFFKDLIKVMEKNGWTPTRLFHELGGASGETITKEKLEDKAPPRSSRMHSAFVRSRNRNTKLSTTPAQEFARLVLLAKEMNVDLVLLGGDILNFPSNSTTTWVLEQLKLAGCDFVFTSGNHDWLLEGQRSASSYDVARLPELTSTFRPFFEQSLTGRSSCYETLGQWQRPGLGFLYGCAIVKGLLLIFVDNSNYQIESDQLEFARVQLANVAVDQPVVVLLHIPLMLPGMSLPPKELCGHQQWGAASDLLWQVEDRPRWPSGNQQSTLDFRELLQTQAAPKGPIVAVLSGHTHEDAAVALGETVEDAQDGACPAGAAATPATPATCRSTWTVQSENGRESPSKATNAFQYTTHSAAEGAYRLLTISA